MVLPVILWGVAAAAGAYGVKKGVDAKGDMDAAKSINNEAEAIYEKAKQELEEARAETQEMLEILGKLKFKVYDELIIPYENYFKKIKHKDFKQYESGESQIPVTNKEFEKYETDIEFKELVKGGITALGAGGLAGLAAYGGVGALASASTGTAIASLSGAAATNATLAWLGGGSLAAGGFGVAGGMAVLGGIVAAPVLAVGGMMWAAKAEEALEDAKANLEQAKLSAEEMQTAVIRVEAIRKKIEELGGVIYELQQIFDREFKTIKDYTVKYDQIEDKLSHKNSIINIIFYPIKYAIQLKLDRQGEGIDYSKWDYEKKIRFFNSFQLYQTMRNLLEVEILSEDGSLSNELDYTLNDVQELIDEKIEKISLNKDKLTLSKNLLVKQ